MDELYKNRVELTEVCPWKLIYYEACLNEKDAKRRERYLKTSQGSRLLKARLKEYFYQQKDNKN